MDRVVSVENVARLHREVVELAGELHLTKVARDRFERQLVLLFNSVPTQELPTKRETPDADFPAPTSCPS